MGKILKAVTSIFKAPKMPEVPTLKMPDAESPAAKLAARKKVMSRGGGRDATIYSQQTYGNSRLGGMS